MKLLLAALPGLLALLFACTKSGTQTAPAVTRSPEEVVKVFIELSASAKDLEDKKKLEQLCLGELRRAFERMTDEVFRIAYLSNNIKLSELKILETGTESDVARVRYHVSVENRQGTDTTREVNEREVSLSRSQGAWFIESIRTKGSDQIAFTNGMIF